MGCDVASAGEMATVLDTGMDPAHVSFAGPGKRSGELAQAVAAGVTINVESPAELEEIARHGDRMGITPRVAVRVNPDFELRGSGMRMGGGAKQFGVDAEEVPALLARIGALDLTFIGFHCFWGSQALRSSLIREAQEKSVELILRLADVAPCAPELVNLGGGFGIPYHDKDTPLSLGEVGEGLAVVVERLERALPEARPGIELGRYLVGEAGVYVCRVVDRKVSRGQVFLVTDGGLHHHLAATGNFGQVLRRNYPVAIGTRMNSNNIETQSIVGCLCTPLDLLADRVELPRAEVGDLVVIFQSGAYGASASPAGLPGPRRAGGSAGIGILPRMTVHAGSSGRLCLTGFSMSGGGKRDAVDTVSEDFPACRRPGEGPDNGGKGRYFRVLDHHSPVIVPQSR